MQVNPGADKIFEVVTLLVRPSAGPGKIVGGTPLQGYFLWRNPPRRQQPSQAQAVPPR